MSRVDPSTFSWVKDEIDESIKQARLSLEAFSTATDDTSQMRMAVAFLHQVSGTLQIVELDGAARLVSDHAFRHSFSAIWKLARSALSERA